MGTWELKADIKGAKGDTGEQGAQGLPGALAATNDAQVAGFITTAGTSETQTAADNRYGTRLSVMGYGAVHDGATDNTVAFRAAVSAAATFGIKSIYAPAGVYSFKPVLNSIVLPLTTGIGIHGDGIGATVFKIEDAANPAAPVNWKGFIGSNTFTTDDLTGLELCDFTFDYNTQNNPVVDVASLGSGNRAMVMAPKGSSIRIHDIDVLNGDGKWVVQLGGTYAAAIQGGYRCDDAFVDINVYNFGVNSAYHDSSGVYVIGDRAKIRGNYQAAATAPGAIAAVEMHGDDYDLSITTTGWLSMGNLTGLDAKTSHGGVVHDCVGRNMMNGFVIWSGNGIGATGYGIDGLTITDNNIELNPDLWSAAGKASPPGNFAHSGIGLNDQGASANLPIRNLKITGNNIRYLAATGTTPKTVDAGISLMRAAVMSGTPAHDQAFDISGNTIISPLGAGVSISLNNQLDGLSVDGLRVHDPAQNGLGPMAAANASGLVVAGKVFSANIRGVDVVDDRSTPVVTCAVDMSSVSNLNPPTGRQSVVDSSLSCPLSAAVPAIVNGPSGTGGVYIRLASYGWVLPTGLFAYGSEIVDYGNGHTYRQTASPAGTAWQVWSEIRPEGVAVGAANVAPSAPTGLTYLPMTTASGAPTGAPTVRSGMVPIVFDNAGKLWAYVGGSWKGIALA